MRTVAGGELSAAVWGMLADALEAYRDIPSAADWLRYHMARFAEPPRIAVTGAAGSGKSTVVNAVVGERVAPVEAAGSQVLTWYSAGDEPRATVYAPDDSAEEVPIGRHGPDLRRWAHHEISRVAVQWPAGCLRDATLIDAPADAAVSDEADAVIHLVRNVDDGALAPLYAAQDSPVGRATPIGTVLVLCRADEIGAGRADALSSARLVARRHDRSARLRGLCQQVLPVAGLVGYAGRTLTAAEYAYLRDLAALDRSALEELLLSTDRFLRAEADTPVGPAARRALLDRFGLFGVRLATALIRGACGTAEQLRAQLIRRSGLDDLRESIEVDLTGRADVLKARSALLAVERLLAAEPRAQARPIAADLERVVASAHEFRELRLLTALRTGRTALPADLAGEARRLLGGHGTGLSQRLAVDDPVATGGGPGGLGGGNSDGRRRAAAAEALARWQDQATNPVLGREQRRAAAVVVRSCEAMLTRLST